MRNNFKSNFHSVFRHIEFHFFFKDKIRLRYLTMIDSGIVDCKEFFFVSLVISHNWKRKKKEFYLIFGDTILSIYQGIRDPFDVKRILKVE